MNLSHNYVDDFFKGRKRSKKKRKRDTKLTRRVLKQDPNIQTVKQNVFCVVLLKSASFFNLSVCLDHVSQLLAVNFVADFFSKNILNGLLFLVLCH